MDTGAKSLIVRTVLIVVLATIVLPNRCLATPNAEDRAAIEHLIDYVRKSRLTFFRNGRPANSDSAAKHIQKKYSHFEKHISSAEDFIEKAATKSMMSGKPYLVKLPSGEKTLVSDFLREELARFQSEKRRRIAK